MVAVAVIIPYFQNKKGILRRAMTSLLNQKLTAPIERIDIMLVDDGSPVPFRDEIEGLDICSPFQLKAIQQQNSGVAGARNAALGALAPDVTHIAFLDSDDVWSQHHLDKAISTLEKGCDFYFCDGRHLGNSASNFEQSFNAFLHGPHARAMGGKLFELEPEAFRGQALRAAAYRIPAVAYRREAAPSLLFDVTLREAGEDSLFLLQLIWKSRKICCSSEEMVLFADGVNIFASTFTWDDPGHLVRHFGALLYYYRLSRALPLAKEDKAYVTKQIWMYRRVFAFLSVRHFAKKRKAWPKKLLELTCGDPRFWLWYPGLAIYVAAGYALRFYNPFTCGDIHHDPDAGASGPSRS